MIERAERKLKSADFLFKNKEYEDAVSRAYYAIFPEQSMQGRAVIKVPFTNPIQKRLKI